MTSPESHSDASAIANGTYIFGAYYLTCARPSMRMSPEIPGRISGKCGKARKAPKVPRFSPFSGESLGADLLFDNADFTAVSPVSA